MATFSPVGMVISADCGEVRQAHKSSAGSAAMTKMK
jgi:hypothetical protein